MFNRFLSVEYAKKHVFNYNKDYYDFNALGGDCTNFVSQCLHAGGIAMNFAKNGWYYLNLNNRSPAWTGVEEFWNFGIKNKGAGLKLTPRRINELEIADIIQLGNGNEFYHTLLVTEVKNGKIFVSAHTRNAFNVPLSDYAFITLRCAAPQ